MWAKWTSLCLELGAVTQQSGRYSRNTFTEVKSMRSAKPVELRILASRSMAVWLRLRGQKSRPAAALRPNGPTRQKQSSTTALQLTGALGDLYF